MSIKLRPATPDDAATIAALADIAGEGLPRTLWARKGSYGQDPLDVGREVALKECGALSWKNATMAELHGEVAGMVLSHELGEEPEEWGSDTDFVVRPLLRLENHALRTRYVSVMSTFPVARRHGVGSALMDAVERKPGPEGMSLILADGNAAGRAFCAARQYREAESVPLVKADWQTDNTSWILLRRP